MLLDKRITILLHNLIRFKRKSTMNLKNPKKYNKISNKSNNTFPNNKYKKLDKLNLKLSNN